MGSRGGWVGGGGGPGVGARGWVDTGKGEVGVRGCRGQRVVGVRGCRGQRV